MYQCSEYKGADLRLCFRICKIKDLSSKEKYLGSSQEGQSWKLLMYKVVSLDRIVFLCQWG